MSDLTSRRDILALGLSGIFVGTAGCGGLSGATMTETKLGSKEAYDFVIRNQLDQSNENSNAGIRLTVIKVTDTEAMEQATVLEREIRVGAGEERRLVDAFGPSEDAEEWVIRAKLASPAGGYDHDLTGHWSGTRFEVPDEAPDNKLVFVSVVPRSTAFGFSEETRKIYVSTGVHETPTQRQA